MMTEETFWDTVKEYIDAKTSSLPEAVQAVLDTYNWDGILAATTLPLSEAILNAQANVDLVINTLLECEAQKLTAKSYADEPLNVKVKRYTVVNGTIVPIDTNDFSALHYAKIAESISSGFIFQGEWDPTTAYPTAGTQGEALAPKMSWTVSSAGVNPGDSVAWAKGDTLVRNVTNDGWDKISGSIAWTNVTGIPANVQNAITDTELQAGLSTKANSSDVNTALALKADSSTVTTELAKKVSSVQEGGVGQLVLNEIVVTQAEYDALTPVDTTYYIIIG